MPENEVAAMDLAEAGAESSTSQPNFWRHETALTNDGPMIVFYSDNHPGHHANIGAIRLPRMSPSKLTDYLSLNYLAIKQMAMGYWHQFNNLVNNANGFGQKLVLEDFGLTFVMRHDDTSFSPELRNEIGLWAADHPSLLSFSELSGPLNAAGKNKTTKDLVLFGHIFLYDEKKRRTARALETVAVPAKPPPNGKIGTHVVEQPQGRFPVGHPQRRKEPKVSKKRVHQEPEPSGSQGPDPSKQKKTQDVEHWKEKNFSVHFPTLPKAAKAPTWPKDGKIQLSAALPEC